MQGKRVFVSGGAGVIGLEVIPRLVERGAKVYVGDLKPKPKNFPIEVLYRQGDLNNITKREIEAFAPDIFIHLAATFERSTETYTFWEENYWHNVCLSHHLMTIFKDLKSLERVVFASSYLIYDPTLYQFNDRQEVPVALHESDRILPRNLTGMAKLAHEIELQFLQQFRSDKFTSICTRIFRGYGKGSRDIISRWIRSLIAGEKITVYRPEGIFDYIFAGDSAEGLVRLAIDKSVSGVINLGTGKARRVSEIVAILKRHFPNAEVVEEESNILYEASQADMAGYFAAVGWKPEMELEQTIPEMISYEVLQQSREKKENLDLGNILVTSSSKKVELVQAVKQAASKLSPSIKTIAGDISNAAVTSYVADDFWQMPPTVDREIDALIRGCKEHKIHTIIPTRDGELLFWANHRQLFAKEGINVIVSPCNTVQVCIDKLAFYEFGITNNLPFIITSDRIDDIVATSFVVKERYGAGSFGVGLNLTKQAAIEYSSQLEYPIYQPFIAGKEISVDAWLNSSHQIKGLVLRTRDSIVDGEAQVTTTFRDAEIEKKVSEILQRLKLQGPVVLQAIIDGNNNIHIIECNARFGGASTASIAVGLDVFYWSILESFRVDVTEYAFERRPNEIRQVRVPRDIHIDL